MINLKTTENSIKLLTAGKYCNDDINVTFEGGSSGTLLKPILDITKTCEGMFSDYQNDNLKELISYNDTENVTRFRTMFSTCKATTFPSLNTSKGTTFDYMYSNCTKAAEFPRLNTDLGTNFSNMFYNNYTAKKIDISKFTSSSTSNSNMFCNNCSQLQAVIIRSFGDTYVLNSNAFTNCHCLKSGGYNGKYGYIYVPRDMIATLQAETNWSTYADIYRALEDYTVDSTTTGEFDDEKAGL